MSYFIGGLSLIGGISIIILAVKRQVVLRRWSLWYGLLLLAAGLAMIIFEYGYPGFFQKNYSVHVYIGGLGLLCYSAFVMNVWKILTCKQKIMAEYTGCRTIKGNKWPDTFMPLFSYEWEGQMYRDIESQCFFFKRKIKKFQSGNQYEIYINPNQPEIIRIARRLSIGDVWIFVIGTMFFLGLLTLTGCTQKENGLPYTTENGTGA